MFKKLKKYTAFTLAEILIVFSIIGIISAITLMTTKRMATTDKYAYERAYDTLRTAAYNAFAESDSQWTEAGTGNVTPQSICRGLAKYINSQGATNVASNDDKFKGDPDKGYCNTSIPTRATISTDNFNGIVPDFIANNGMKFYITNEIVQTNVRDDISDTNNSSVAFKIVYIDLDGEDGQNMISAGDVVAFAITNNADVIPLGLPAYDKHYLTARVIYPESVGDEDADAEKLSDAMSYYDAIHTAWGGLQSLDDMRTVDFNNFSKLSGAVFLSTVTKPSAADTPSQAVECVCDVNDPDVTCDEAHINAIPVLDKFECDIKIQRYY